MSGIRRNSRGDTIIEVMFAMAIIGVVLAAAYATASTNLRTSQLAKERTQASKIAESQLEQLKTLADLDEITETSFCLNIEEAASVVATEIATPATECVEGFYEKTIEKNGADYTVIVSWIPPGGSDTNKANVTFYYSDYDFDLSTSLRLGVFTVSSGSTDAIIGATVLNSSGVLSRGIVYGPVGSTLEVGSGDPLVISVTNNETTTGYEVSINGLNPSAEYIVRSWVETAIDGYVYSSTETIGTLPSSQATVETSDPATAVTTASATVSGNVTNDNGSPVTSRGVAYGTSPQPSISGLFEPSGGGVGSFNASVSGLAPNTTYFARAYATNANGTSYGDQVTFDTLNVPAGITYDSSFGGSSYFVSTSRVTLSQALSAAASSGGHLVTITSPAENAHVSNIAGGERIWIGLTDSASEDIWEWVTGEPFAYENWNPPIEPNNAGAFSDEDWVVMNWSGSSSGTWNDWYDAPGNLAFYVIEY